MKDLINNKELLESTRIQIKKLLEDKKLNEANSLIRSFNYYQLFEESEYKLNCLELLLNSNKLNTKVFEKLFEIMVWYPQFTDRYKRIAYQTEVIEDTLSFISYGNSHDDECKSLNLKYYISKNQKPYLNKNIVNDKKYISLLKNNMENLSLFCVSKIMKNKDVVVELIEEDNKSFFCLKLLDVLDKNEEFKERVFQKAMKNFFEKNSTILLQKYIDLFKEELSIKGSKKILENIDYLKSKEKEKIIAFKKMFHVNKIKVNYVYIEKMMQKFMKEEELCKYVENLSLIINMNVYKIFELLEKNKFNTELLKKKYEKSVFIKNLEDF